MLFQNSEDFKRPNLSLGQKTPMQASLPFLLPWKLLPTWLAMAWQASGSQGAFPFLTGYRGLSQARRERAFLSSEGIWFSVLQNLKNLKK